MSNTNFDDVKTFNNTKEMLEESVAKYGKRPAYWERIKENGGKYHPITFEQFKQDVDALGTALIDMGLENETTFIVGKNGYKYVTTCRTVMGGVGCIAPGNKDFSEDELLDLITRAKSKAVFFTDEVKEKIINISKRIDSVKYYISMSSIDPENGILSYEDVLSRGNELVKNGNRRYVDKEIDDDKMAMLLFTSGTTDKPKGVMLSNKNICLGVARGRKSVRFYENDIFYSVLPMHHIFEQSVGILMSSDSGASVAFSDDIMRMQKDLQEIHPTVIPCVPAHVEFIYARCWAGIRASGKQQQVEQLFSQGELGVEKGREIFKDIYNSLGGRLRLLISGADAASPETLKGMRNFGMPAVSGYGRTEDAGCISVNHIDNYKDTSSMGLMAPDLNWKIVNPNEDGIGELVVEPNFLGYLDDEEATNEAIRDGWSYTTDLVNADKDGFFYFFTRTRNLIKTSDGEYVSPEKLEKLLFNNPYIKESVVFKQPSKAQDTSVLGVSLFPDKEKITEIFGFISDTEIEKLLQEQILLFNRTVAPHEVIRHVGISDKAFPKTATGKIQRFLLGNQQPKSNTNIAELAKIALSGRNPATLETVQEIEIIQRDTELENSEEVK